MRAVLESRKRAKCDVYPLVSLLLMSLPYVDVHSFILLTNPKGRKLKQTLNLTFRRGCGEKER